MIGMNRLQYMEAHLKIRTSPSIGSLKITKTIGSPLQLPIYSSRDSYYLQSKDLAKIIIDDRPLFCYDAGLAFTISATSSISYIDGDKGALEYRGYPIEQLAQKSTFLEVAFLVIYGQLPGKQQFMRFSQQVSDSSTPHFDLTTFMKSFRYDAHPMGILVATLSAYSSLCAEANPALKGASIYSDPAIRNKQIYNLLGILPTIVANSYRHRIGRSFNPPQPQMGYVENFLWMLDRLSEKDYRSHPKLIKAFQTLFIIHAQHEVNCSTALLRHLASAGTDVYTAVATAAGALYGTRHGGANATVISMLEKIGKKENIGPFLEDVKNKKQILFGFGHRVYKSQDPRAKIAKKVAEDVFDICGREPLIELAEQIEKAAAHDDYFLSRKLFPNVDFYTGLIYRSMGFPTDIYPVLFALPLLAGWLAHWVEVITDPQTILPQPQQDYKGKRARSFVPLNQRQQNHHQTLTITSQTSRRRQVSHEALSFTK